jgi:hypothetical protein
MLYLELRKCSGITYIEYGNKREPRNKGSFPSFLREIYIPYYDRILKEGFKMEKFAKVACIVFASFIAGALYDSSRMANDKMYHDYWMERSKKSK